MTGATHMLAAAAVYSTVRNKPAALVLAFSSHFVLDAIKHFEVSLTWNLALMVFAGWFLFRTALSQKDTLLLVAAAAGILPDLNWILNLSQAGMEIHQTFHFVKNSPVPAFFLWLEFLFAALLVYFILRDGTLNQSAVYKKK